MGDSRHPLIVVISLYPVFHVYFIKCYLKYVAVYEKPNEGIKLNNLSSTSFHNMPRKYANGCKVHH